MKRYIHRFHRDGKYFAELHLNLSSGFMTVESWAWHGDPSASKMIAPLPDEKGRYYELWFMDSEDAAEREGLEMTREYVGDPPPTAQDYFPSKETIANLEAFQKEWDRTHGK